MLSKFLAGISPEHFRGIGEDEGEDYEALRATPDVHGSCFSRLYALFRLWGLLSL
jgi:hypothetical protein